MIEEPKEIKSPNWLDKSNFKEILTIKSCKATNLEFLKLQEELGLCLYEDICGEKEFILMSEESFIQYDVENKQSKEN